MSQQSVHARLMAEGRCALTLCRSSHGRISLTIRTHTLGMITMELTADQFTDLIFGTAETGAILTRVLPRRLPA